MDWALVWQEWQALPSASWEIVQSPWLLLAVFVGSVMGLIFGMLPGISAVMSMSLLVGLVFKAPVEVGLGLLISIYVGAMASGGVTAILVNIPGTPAAAATGVDGFPMA
ncbi:tripartite tricarboxylate transporter permease, partial [Verrucomicrobia bacterium]|nr:tripartite tricarboxylate transporter permease [Verrucomicrobiota bacterium]